MNIDLDNIPHDPSRIRALLIKQLDKRLDEHARKNLPPRLYKQWAELLKNNNAER